MYRKVSVPATTPRSVRAFIATVCDVYLADVHAMLRLPCSDAGITQACNFAVAATLLNAISGASVVLYEPPANNIRGAGRKFKGLAREFYPWRLEPTGFVKDGDRGSRLLYNTFRNPMSHAFGFQEKNPRGPINITRVAGNGFTEQELEDIETSTWRPGLRLGGAGTLLVNQATNEVSLNGEAFYWGIREMFNNICSDANRMRAAAAYLDPLLVQNDQNQANDRIVLH